jgi:hypothetical protein
VNRDLRESMTEADIEIILNCGPLLEMIRDRSQNARPY